MSRRLLHFGRGLYASPAYVAEVGTPSSIKDLKEHRIAAHSIVDVRESLWRHDGKTIRTHPALPTPRWIVNDTTALERIALSGAGIALIPTIQGASLASQGLLVRLLPEVEQHGATATLVWPASRHLSPRVRAFIDHAVETMSSIEH